MALLSMGLLGAVMTTTTTSRQLCGSHDPPKAAVPKVHLDPVAEKEKRKKKTWNRYIDAKMNQFKFEEFPKLHLIWKSFQDHNKSVQMHKDFFRGNKSKLDIAEKEIMDYLRDNAELYNAWWEWRTVEGCVKSVNASKVDTFISHRLKKASDDMFADIEDLWDAWTKRIDNKMRSYVSECQYELWRAFKEFHEKGTQGWVISQDCSDTNWKKLENILDEKVENLITNYLNGNDNYPRQWFDTWMRWRVKDAEWQKTVRKDYYATSNDSIQKARQQNMIGTLWRDTRDELKKQIEETYWTVRGL